MGFKDSALWELLQNKADRQNKYLAGVETICEKAVTLANTIQIDFPLFTRHDEVHICNVLKIMAQLLGDRMNELNQYETALLIMAACCHDIGMSADSNEKEQLRNNSLEMKQYLNERPDEYVKAYTKDGMMPNITDELLRNYIRANHHLRSKKLIQNMVWPNGLKKELRKNLIWVCQSHGKSCDEIERDLTTSNDADLHLCAVLLRLADILDFDISRAPQTLYEYYGFKNAESYEELFSKLKWDEHQASDGFNLDPESRRNNNNELPFSASPDSMQVENGIQCYLDWVDQELYDCNNLLRKYTGAWSNLELPFKVSRSITPNGYLSGQYHFTLDQSQLLQLLGGDELYSDPSAFVRELLQNAIDAVRTRKELDKNLPPTWKPQIKIRTWSDENGYDWFRIEDNGIGMTEGTVLNHLLKVGSSYYNSDEFKKEKLLSNASADYMPISRFGIGILSCFIGDTVNNTVDISTKHYNSAILHGLRLHMHGLRGYYSMHSREKGHNPDIMPGCKPGEGDLYLDEPGTVVAVRTCLYRSGNNRGFKEIVDRYVVYPPVPVHYDGPEGSYDYVTEQEFMAAIHNIAPSENLAEDGVLEFTLTPEELNKLKKPFPSIDLSNPPKILLKCAALDKYTESRNITGAMVIARIQGDIPPIELIIGKQRYFLNFEFKLTSNHNILSLNVNPVLNDFQYYLPWSPWRPMSRPIEAYTHRYKSYKAQRLQLESAFFFINKTIFSAIQNNQINDPIWRQSIIDKSKIDDNVLDEWIKETWLKIQRTTNMSKEELQLYFAIEKIEQEASLKVIDLNNIKWYKRFFSSVHIITKLDDILVHNGIQCGNSSGLFDHFYGNTMLSCMLLMHDKYRPKLNLARNKIQALPLEAAFECEMILRQLKDEKYNIISYYDLYNLEQPYKYLPANDFYMLLKDRPDWIEKMIVQTNDGSFPVNKLQIDNSFKIDTEFLPDYGKDQTLWKGLYGHFVSSYLQAKYSMLRITTTYRFQLTCCRILQDDSLNTIFPPALFLLFDDTEFTYFIHSTSSSNRCNANHRLSKFLINYGKVIKEKSPGSIYKFIEILATKDNDDLINSTNEQLEILQKIPNFTFNITNDLFLDSSDVKFSNIHHIHVELPLRR